LAQQPLPQDPFRFHQLYPLNVAYLKYQACRLHPSFCDYILIAIIAIRVYSAFHPHPILYPSPLMTTTVTGSAHGHFISRTRRYRYQFRWAIIDFTRCRNVASISPVFQVAQVKAESGS